MYSHEQSFSSVDACGRGLKAVDWPLQAQVQVRDLSSGQPHYQWLPLQRSSAAAMGLQAPSESEQAGAQAPVAELHVRVHWSSEDLAQANDTSPSLTAELALSGVGISVVDASFMRLPREVCAQVCSATCLKPACS